MPIKVIFLNRSNRHMYGLTSAFLYRRPVNRIPAYEILSCSPSYPFSADSCWLNYLCLILTYCIDIVTSVQDYQLPT